MQNQIITPLSKDEILNIFDSKALEILNYYIQLNCFSHPESKVNQDNINFQVTKEYMEQWVVQAINAEPLGAGSYPVDVKTKNFIADIKSMKIKTNTKGQITNSESGETSLGQKFDIDNLDSLFTENKRDDIKNLWVKILDSKYKKAIKETNINKILYIFLMPSATTYFLFIFQLDHTKIKKENISVNNNRSTKDSVYLDGMISELYGSTKIYKAKKRLELRLKPKKLIDDGYFYKIADMKYPNKINIRDIDNFQNYISKKIKVLQKIL